MLIVTGIDIKEHTAVKIGLIFIKNEYCKSSFLLETNVLCIILLSSFFLAIIKPEHSKIPSIIVSSMKFSLFQHTPTFVLIMLRIGNKKYS